MKVYIIGIGMDGLGTLTVEAKKIIKEADIHIGAARMLKPFSYMNKPSFECWKADEIRDYLISVDFEKAAILMSGDIGFYSGADKLLNVLSDFDTEAICGVSSPTYFFSKINLPWQNVKFASLHGSECNIIRTVCRNEYSFFLLGGKLSPKDVCQKLCDFDLGDLMVYIGENLSYDNEKIYIGAAKEFCYINFSRLSVITIYNPTYEKIIYSGIKDSKFIRGSVPMTKSELRSSIISKLQIENDSICWDVGCGTGSVTVEMALSAYNGKVFASDKNPEAVSLTLQNSKKFKCDNVKVALGNAPDCLKDLPSPNRVFIGGSCGNIEDIISLTLNKNLFAVIIITAVSIETLNSALLSLKKHDIDSPEVTQISVTRTVKRGQNTMFSAENPVFIIKGEIN